MAALRARYPQLTVAELYDHPRLGSLAEFLDELAAAAVTPRDVEPTPATQTAQVVLSVPLATLTGLQWVTWLALINNSPPPCIRCPGWWRSAGGWSRWRSWCSSPRSGGWASRCWAPACCCPVEPGTYRRGGSEHLRVWLAERLADASGAENQAGAPWLVYYARALGNKVGKGVDLHSAPPVTGMLQLGHRCSIEPEVDLTGHWIDGDEFHVGPITVGNDSTIGARTTLFPGAVVGKDADVAPGSGVVGKVKNGQYWKGSPAVKSGKARHPWPQHRPPRAAQWLVIYGLTSVLLGGVPLVALACGLAVLAWPARHTATFGSRAVRRAVDSGGHPGGDAASTRCSPWSR